MFGYIEKTLDQQLHNQFIMEYISILAYLSYH